MATVDVLTTIIVPVLLVAVFAIPVWALRRQNRMFPKGFDRTGWNPDPDKAGWFMTKFTWLSGGRGPS
jgi:hypothetical protein